MLDVEFNWWQTLVVWCVSGWINASRRCGSATTIRPLTRIAKTADQINNKDTKLTYFKDDMEGSSNKGNTTTDNKPSCNGHLSQVHSHPDNATMGCKTSPIMTVYPVQAPNCWMVTTQLDTLSPHLPIVLLPMLGYRARATFHFSTLRNNTSIA